MSYYGCVLWNLSNPSIKCFDVCMNNILCQVWSLPFNCHTSILHVISGCHSIYNTCYKRFYNMLCLAKSSCNYLVHSVFHASSLSCHSFVGYNYKFSSSLVRDYSRVDFSLVRLIKEIRDSYLYVPGFDHFSHIIKLHNYYCCKIHLLVV